MFPIDRLAPDASNVPIETLTEKYPSDPLTEEGVKRFRMNLSDGYPLETLLINKMDADVLVVSFHGALD